MSFEQPAYSFNHLGGEPPTPTRTPTSPDFFSNSYQTPKQEKFHDPLSPWTPALGFSPIFNSHAHLSHTISANDHSTPSASKRPRTAEDVGAEVASRAQHSSSNLSVSLAPVDTSQQLTSSPQTSFSFDSQPLAHTAGPAVTPSKLSIDQGASSSMNSASSMQTPPPTSTSASRRKASEAQAARSARALAPKEDRKMSSPTAGNGENPASADQNVDESPSAHFPNLQFSPDGFGFPMSTGPATAPVYPQHKLFWDPEQSMDNMNLDFSMDDSFTNFGLGLQKQLEPFVSDHDQSTGMQFPTTPAFSAAGSSNVNIANLTAPKHSMALNQTNVSPSTAIMTQGSSRGKFAGTVVNPSLLFSSPGRAELSSSQTVQDDALKPYAHQLQDAEIEKELRSRRPKRKRGVEMDSPAVKAATQALRGAEEESTTDSADGAVTASFGGLVRPKSRHSRKGSAQERSSSRGQGSGLKLADSGKRTSVTLTIDANGRAKTETKVVDEPSKSTFNRMEMDSDSTDSDSSSSRSSQGMARSQPSSFAFPVERQKKPKTLKSSRLHSGHISHSHQSSYESTIGSTSNTNNAPRGIQVNTKLGRSSQPQVHFQDTTSFIGATLDGDDSEAETVVDTDEDKGNAASALKRVVRQRSNQNLRKSSTPRQSFADHRMPNTGPLQPYYSQNTMTSSRLSYSNPQQNISPTTITDPDMATPSTGGRSGLSTSSVTRCVCDVMDGNGQLMVQCDSCKNWLHLQCVGLTQHNIPEVYICGFCNHDTPKVRGGRREPARAAFPPPSSPLAYKSGHYR